MAKATKQQFRPYLTLEQLQHLISLTEKDGDNHISARLNSYLKVFALKAGAGMVTTHTTTRETLEEKLGLELSTQSPVEKRKFLYEQWSRDPNSVSIAQLPEIHTYRYESGLMSEHEATQFEAALLS